MSHENRQYLIFNVSEINLVNFDDVLETSAETVRKSLDQTKTFVKWEGAEPSFVSNLTTKEGPYTYTEILEIMNSPQWTDPSAMA